MAESILDDTKKSLGIAPDYDAFDPDIIMHINSALGALQQLGVGPVEGLMINDAETKWDALLYLREGAVLNVLNMAKSYIYHKVRLAFDPPNTPFGINAIQDQIKELEWRISVARETDDWVDPVTNDSIPPSDRVFGDVIVFDGGTI